MTFWNEDYECIAPFDAADYLMYAAVVTPEVEKFFVGEEEGVRHFVVFHCFGD